MTAPPHWPSGATCSTRPRPPCAATSSPPSWPNGSPPSPAPASTPTTSCAPRPPKPTCPTTTPPPRCGGGSAATSPPPSPPASTTSHTLTPTWTTHLTTALGTERARDLQDSPFWPALVTAVDHALARGHRLDTVTAMAGLLDPSIDVDPCQALVWRLSVLTDPPPALHDDAGSGVPVDDPAAEPMEDEEDGWWPPDGGTLLEAPDPTDPVGLLAAGGVDDDCDRRRRRTTFTPTCSRPRCTGSPWACWSPPTPRSSGWSHGPPPGTTPSPTRHGSCRSTPWPWTSTPPTSTPRGPGTTSTTASPAGATTRTSPPGTPPPGGPPWWTTCAAAASPTTNSSRPAWPPAPAPGTSSTASATGPCSPSPTRTRSSGSSAAATPTSPTTTTPARSTSTPPTPCCSTRARSSTGRSQALLQAGAVPVLVEGPIDALAVTLAGDGRYVGVAPLGTALTDDQARQLATLSARPIVATDADLPGRVAAERAYWLLAQHGADPLTLDLPDGADPASVLHAHGPAALRHALDNARPLAQVLIDERLTNLPRHDATRGRNPRDRSPTAINVGGSHRRHRRTSRRRHGHRHWVSPHGRHRVEQRPGTSRRAPPHRNLRRADPPRGAARMTPPAGGPRLPTRSTPASPRRATGPLSPRCSRPRTTLVTTSRRSPDDWSHDAPLGEMPAQELRYRLVATLPETAQLPSLVEETSLWWRPGVPTAANRVPPPLTDTP